MSDEIELFSDGDGIALIGDQLVIEQFLAAEKLESRTFDLKPLNKVAASASNALQVGSEIAANSGRWVKLTEKSAKVFKTADLMKGSEVGVSRAIAIGKDKKISNILEFVSKPTAMLTNPAILAGAAGIMAQIAMQQAMDEITDYLKTIDEKCDDILQAQKDNVLSHMIGVGAMIDEAMTIRHEVGYVSEVTWSKVQASPQTVARTQAYALQQLDALANKLESEKDVDDLAKTAKNAGKTVQEWLVVLARCVQLQDALAVLELDRVFDAQPSEIENHRRALKLARQKRLDAIEKSVESLVDRINSASALANDKVLFNPISSSRVLRSGAETVRTVGFFQETIGISATHQSVDPRGWAEAAIDARDEMIDATTKVVEVTKRAGEETYNKAKSTTQRLSNQVFERFQQKNDGEDNGSTDKN